MAPATLLVTIVMLAALVAGVVILKRAMCRTGRGGSDEQFGTQSKCPHCKTLYATHAHFCSRCGKPLN